MDVPSTAVPSSPLVPMMNCRFTPVPSRFALPIVFVVPFVQKIPAAFAEGATSITRHPREAMVNNGRMGSIGQAPSLPLGGTPKPNGSKDRENTDNGGLPVWGSGGVALA